MSENCNVCGSASVVSFNSYKHRCLACKDCNSITHIKKTGKYLLEYFLPSKLLSRIIPRQASQRLFHATKEFDPSEFYDVYKKECENPTQIRLSEFKQLVDQFGIIDVDLSGKSILDVSGGPGVVAKSLSGIASDVVVTEYSETTVKAMKDSLSVGAVRFDYKRDSLIELFPDVQFDVVLLRSSIIFCDDLLGLISDIKKILSPGGYVLLESIVPSLGEVFWWQQMEYKFPVIYAQESIEKSFAIHGFSMMLRYRERGSYVANKWRGGSSLPRKIFTWFVDYPMMLLYYSLARKGKIPIDQSTDHKMVTYIWKNQMKEEMSLPIKFDFISGEDVLGVPAHTTHFTHAYNGFLKNIESVRSRGGGKYL